MIRKDETLTMKVVFIGLGLLTVVGLQGCHNRKAEGLHAKGIHSVRAKLHEVVFGQAENVIWGHKISITPCRNVERQTLSDNAPLDSHHVIKCGETKVEVVNEELRVNEKNYGKLNEKVRVLVENGKVFINGSEVKPATQVAQK